LRFYFSSVLPGLGGALGIKCPKQGFRCPSTIDFFLTARTCGWSKKEKVMSKLSRSAMLIAALITLEPSLHCSPASAQASGIIITENVGEIERLIKVLSKHRSMPSWWVDLFLRAVDVYQNYRNGKQIRAARKTVHAALIELAAIKSRIENGETRAEEEFAKVRDQLADHEGRIAGLEREVVLIRLIEKRMFRRGCGVVHAWRKGRCINVADNPL
jgi:hypothetical protein